MEKSAQICEMIAEDYDDVVELWRFTEGIGLDNATDSREGVADFLHQNPGLSFVAREDGQLVGAVLCGHDGRRGYLHHLAVARANRHQSIGQALVERCLAELGALGIRKCNIFLYAVNEPGERFWKHLGWKERADLKVLQKETPGNPA
jgi:putative acetyltransferase